MVHIGVGILCIGAREDRIPVCASKEIVKFLDVFCTIVSSEYGGCWVV